METNAPSSIPIGHPAPLRHRVGLAALLFGLAAAPLAWDAQMLMGAAVSGFVCYPHARPLAAPVWAHTTQGLLAVSLTGIVFSLAAGLIAWRCWLPVSREHPSSAHQLLDRGEGRTRFVAMCGMLTSALFLIALAFGTIVVLLVPECGR